MAVISENKLKKIISSVIEEQISERGTNLSSLYHFTDIHGLAGIMNRGAFELSSLQQDIRGGKNYMSFTRHKSPLEGFALPSRRSVRIEVIPELINSIHGKSIDSFEYYSPNMAKKADKCNPWSNMSSDNGDISAKAAYRVTKRNPIDWFNAEDAEFLNQAEEHLTSGKEFIDAEKAIKRIDIYAEFDKAFCQSYKEYIYGEFLEVFQMANSPLYDKIFIYDNVRDFSLQTDNCTPIREYSIEKLRNALGFDGTRQNVAESANIAKIENMDNLYLELGYNWEANYPRPDVEYVIFSVIFTNGEFTDCVACGAYRKGAQFPDSIKVRIHIDNLDDAEKEYVLRELNAGNVKQFAYDDEPDETYNYAVADIKPFVMSHLDDAVRRLKTDWHPDWQKDRIMKILGSMKKDAVKINENVIRRIVAESMKKALNEEGIHIKEKNRGKFNATKERTGKSTEELTRSKNPLTRKRANFARMAKRGWKPLKNKD
jgi:hypothetical protein